MKNKKWRALGLLLSLAVMVFSREAWASAFTLCNNSTDILDVSCYADGNCTVIADDYGGYHHYVVPANHINKNHIVSIALSAMLSSTKAHMAFEGTVNCADVPQWSVIYGLGASK